MGNRHQQTLELMVLLGILAKCNGVFKSFTYIDKLRLNKKQLHNLETYMHVKKLKE